MIIHRSHALTQSCAHVQRIMMNQTMHFFVIQSYSYSLCIFMCTYTIQHDINVFQFINSIKVCISLGMNKHHCQRYVIVNIVHYPMCVGTFKLFFCFLSASNNNNNNNQRKKNRKTNNENKLGKKSCKHALAQKKKSNENEERNAYNTLRGMAILIQYYVSLLYYGTCNRIELEFCFQQFAVCVRSIHILCVCICALKRAAFFANLLY